MKKIPICLLGVVGLIVCGMPQAIAQPQGCGSSFIILPNGKCVSLTYMTILSRSRANLKESQSLYIQALQLNASAGTMTSVTESVGNSRRSISSTTSVFDNPSEQEKADRRKFLQNSAQTLDQASIQNDDIERWGFREQVKALSQVQRAYGY